MKNFNENDETTPVKGYRMPFPFPDLLLIPLLIAIGVLASLITNLLLKCIDRAHDNAGPSSEVIDPRS